MRWPWNPRRSVERQAERNVHAEEVRIGWLPTGSGPSSHAGSPARPLYQDDDLDRDVAELRGMLAADAAPETRAALQTDLARGIEAFGDAWFQRIDFPGHPLMTTSDHRLAHLDQGGLNTLGGRLTSDEASILRPWPKWMYLRRILPDLRGKTVLEIGSANGFFCFRFADLGAHTATGVEANRRMHDSAVWAAEARGCHNVRFIQGDALLDLTLPRHDVVFLSEVWNHFLSPSFGLLRILSLARECVVLDTGIHDEPGHHLQLTTGWRKEGSGLIYHSFLLSEDLLMDLLALMGVEASRISRYKTPPDQYHAVYVIDTRGLEDSRRRIDYPEYLRAALDLRFRIGEPSTSER